MTDSVVVFENVVAARGGRTVLRGINLRIGPGETVVLLGRSGSGKTTMLRLVNRLELPLSGRVNVLGRSNLEWDPVDLRRRIGYVVQEGGLLPHLTVADNVAFVGLLRGQSYAELRDRVQELLLAVGLAPDQYAQRHPSELSGGERQRVGVARALCADPALLLFDEPFAALDPLTRLDIQRLYVSLRERFGKSSLFVTHDIAEALRIATRIALLVDGEIVLEAEPREFRQSHLPAARAFLAGLEV